jgi:hypothetical protein
MASLAVALLMAAFVLPTILRQSPPQTNQTAQLSPDAPQNNQQSLISALKRGSTSTAGTGAGQGVGPGAGKLPPPPRVLPPVAKQVPSYCPFGYGTPTRQTFSVYSAPCGPAFTGDNGGATAPGVTATEIRIALPGSENMRVTSSCGQDSTHQLLCDWEAWINSRYQLYGRQMHLYYVTNGASPAAAQAGAVQARAQNMFGAMDVVPLNPEIAPAYAGQKLVTWTFYRPNSFFRANAPYAWSWHASNDRIMDIGGELVCKQLANKPPEFNERKDANFDYSKPRIFGAVVLEQGGGTTNQDLMKKALARCGVSLKRIVAYRLDSGQASLGAAMTQFKTDGVTTILDFGDQLSTSTMATAATKQQYFPEWVAYGTHNLEQSSFVQGIDPAQWKHAIGLSFSELPRTIGEMDWYIAACQVDPNCANLGLGYSGEGPVGTQSVFTTFLEMANGLQLAGPRLTADSYARGLHTLSRRPEPSWAVGGSFQDPDPWTFEKYAQFEWWDPNATDPATGGQGAWTYVNNGRRYTTGEVPTTPLPFFKSGVTQPPSG